MKRFDIVRLLESHICPSDASLIDDVYGVIAWPTWMPWIDFSKASEQTTIFIILLTPRCQL